MDKELQAIFESIDSTVLNEQTLTAISTLVEQTVERKVNDRLTLEVESRLKVQDDEHIAKFKKLVEAVDKDHTAKVKKVVEHLNKDHTNKLGFIKEKYETLLKETAIAHKDELAETVDSFLEKYIEEAIPQAQIQEAAKNSYIQKVLAEARDILSVDPTIMKDSVKTAIRSGKEQIDNLQKENAELKKQRLVSESKKLLIEHTANLPREQAKFIYSRLADKSPQFIKENFKYVKEMFARQENNQKRSTLNDIKPNVDRSKVADELLKETTTFYGQPPIVESANSLEDLYMEGLNFKK